MGDDSKKRDEEDEVPATDEIAGGAFFRAPTRAFVALPTEVLHIGTGERERPRPAKEPPALSSPPATVAMAPWELESIHSEPSDDDYERTSPEPFRPDLPEDSAERALFAVAREATHPDLMLGDDGEEPSVTSTDRGAPRPVTGVHGSRGGASFDEGTLGLDGEAPRAPSFDHEITDEDGRLPREVETSPEGRADDFGGEPTDAGHDDYLEQVRAFDFARVYDPAASGRISAGFERPETSDEWPEITLDKLPAVPSSRPSGGRWWLPVALFAVFALALAATGGVLYLVERGKQADVQTVP